MRQKFYESGRGSLDGDYVLFKQKLALSCNGSVHFARVKRCAKLEHKHETKNGTPMCMADE